MSDPILYFNDESDWSGFGGSSGDYLYNGHAASPSDSSSSGVWSWLESQFSKGTAAVDYMVTDWLQDSVYAEQIQPPANVPTEQGFSFGSAGNLMPLFLLAGLGFLAYRLSK